MNDTHSIHERPTTLPNPLAPVVVGLIRSLSMERDAHESTRCVLREAIAMMANQDRKLDIERSNRLDLLAQYRAAISGRTNAEERQAIAVANEMPEGTSHLEQPQAA